MSIHNLCFEQKYEKISEFLSENFQFLVVKFSVYLNSRVFVMTKKRCFSILSDHIQIQIFQHCHHTTYVSGSVENSVNKMVTYLESGLYLTLVAWSRSTFPRINLQWNK